MKQSRQSWLWWTCLVPFISWVYRHPRESGGPGANDGPWALVSRLRGNDRKCSSGSSQHPHRGEAAQRVLNAPELGVGCQAGERAGEMWVLRARKDVLPAVGFEKGLLDHAGLEPV